MSTFFFNVSIPSAQSVSRTTGMNSVSPGNEGKIPQTTWHVKSMVKILRTLTAVSVHLFHKYLLNS